MRGRANGVYRVLHRAGFTNVGNGGMAKKTDLAPRDLDGKDFIEEHDEAVALSRGERRALRKEISGVGQRRPCM